jgi:hypothetical protein
MPDVAVTENKPAAAPFEPIFPPEDAPQRRRRKAEQPKAEQPKTLVPITMADLQVIDGEMRVKDLRVGERGRTGAAVHHSRGNQKQSG